MLKNFKYIMFAFGFIPITWANSQSTLDRNISVYVTSQKTSQRMERVEVQDYTKAYQPAENEACIFVDTLSKFQKFVGIGGAFTDAAAETFYKLSVEKQKELITMYFDEKFGIGYSFGRTNINSCDFSSGTYSYVKDGDKSLQTFDIEHDRHYKIPLIKEALKATNGKLNIFASPWSPPAYMKDNANMLQGGKLLPEFYRIWAKYYIKFINEYEKEGIPIWGLSVQNEPMAKQTWESCIYTADDELIFIKNYLGPELYKNKMQNKKLIAWDHNRDLLYHRANTLLHDKSASRYIWGIGFHWYEIWNGGRQYDNVRRVKEAFPTTNLLLTEACNYPFDWNTFDQWSWGEQYGENMIQDFNNGAVAWTDWNILLDETGGPNHVGNFCFAPVHAKTHENSLHLMNSYYYIGHFSKFIRPGARRIAVSSNRAQLLSTGFKNPDGSLVVVIMNKTEEDIDYKLFNGNKALLLKISNHSIMTIVI